MEFIMIFCILCALGLFIIGFAAYAWYLFVGIVAIFRYLFRFMKWIVNRTSEMLKPITG